MTPRLPLLWLMLLLALAACGAAAEPAPSADPVADGRRLFAIWCSGCHSVEAGAPEGIGPNLALVAVTAALNPDGLSAAEWLRRETVDPNASITLGYSPGLMPTNYEQSLRPEQIDALVAYMLTLR